MVPKYIKENANDVVFNLEYNAERPHLIIPEYGRHLQKLIDQATVIENDEERNKAARYIIQVMGSLNPHLRDVLDFQHKLWDQLFIMSDFKLVVDSPYPIPTREVINLKPERLAYPQKNPKYRFYGNNIKYMIEVADKWEEGEMKSALIKVIANHMKKSYLSWNKDTVTDAVIFEHLYELSDGKFNLTQSQEELLTTNDLIRTNKKVSNKSLMPQQKNLKIQGFKKPIPGKKPFVKNNNNNNPKI
ncbi:DUF4290 domain-containing protein [Flavobacterium aquatile]|uniref:Methionyl-tRNA formyltransferase n=1 Tax=Flavobacterium aquatile LMG 4008 = ATCC 11947 TaxID=1453498 RepID=A0A095SYL3_9FLAO|nr:DUF4290 domain-containing protein [Flavobacterium aquatile]KGD69617.1 hypothetical protein LG45_02355 [Flavobacterium aquatile LMG 4008 = ATCC 11947]OXA67244.1 hypothetical protein B0A61_08530 [Flavobacterium aquatile LMG 4008 = ATCC 11947]GEC77901.1 hypothetical protein FAQ01_07710 [Flavobacterium aquatile]